MLTSAMEWNGQVTRIRWVDDKNEAIVLNGKRRSKDEQVELWGLGLEIPILARTEHQPNRLTPQQMIFVKVRQL